MSRYLPQRFWFSVLVLSVAFAALASSPSIRAQSPSTTWSAITENERSVVFGNSTSTANAIRVVCLTTATSTINATRTGVTYTGLQTALVVKSTVTVTQPVIVTVTSTTTIATCYAYSERFVATRFVSVPLVQYFEAQGTVTQTSSWHPGPCCVPGQTESTPMQAFVITLMLASLLAALVLLWATASGTRKGKRPPSDFKATP